MGAFFGFLAALTIGLSDLFGRRVVNASHSLTATAAVQLVAIFTSLATVLFVDGDPIRRDLAIGLASGLGFGVGLSAYLHGLARSTSTVVAPIVATLSAVIPFVYAAATGHAPSVAATVGAAVAIGGLGVIALGGGAASHVRIGVLLGVVSGVGYGFGLTVMIEASPAAGVWPAVTQRIGALVLVLVVASVGRVSVVPPTGYRLSALWAGIFAGTSTIAYLLGVQIDAPVAVVTGSTFPAFTVVIGWLVFRDEVTHRQLVGLVAVLIGVAAVVAG